MCYHYTIPHQTYNSAETDVYFHIKTQVQTKAWSLFCANVLAGQGAQTLFYSGASAIEWAELT